MAENGGGRYDEVIKQYLIKGGYQQAALAFEAEKRERGGGERERERKREEKESQNQSSTTGGGDIPSLLLDFYSKEAKEQVKLEDYKLFHEWVSSSLDVVKPDLLAVCFPIMTNRLFSFPFFTSFLSSHFLPNCFLFSLYGSVFYSHFLLLCWNFIFLIVIYYYASKVARMLINY
jgi:hypothetical protein